MIDFKTIVRSAYFMARTEEFVIGGIHVINYFRTQSYSYTSNFNTNQYENSYSAELHDSVDCRAIYYMSNYMAMPYSAELQATVSYDYLPI